MLKYKLTSGRKLLLKCHIAIRDSNTTPPLFIMAKKAQPKKPSGASTSSAIPLSQPDRSGPSEKTLFQLASERGLLNPDTHRAKSGALPKNAVPIRKPVPDEDLSRLGNSVLWSTSMAMLHFTFDVLTSHQYAETIVWADLFVRAAQAFISMSHPLAL